MNEKPYYRESIQGKRNILKYLLAFITGAGITIIILALAGVFKVPMTNLTPTACMNEERYLDYHGESGIAISAEQAIPLIRNYHAYDIVIQPGIYNGLPFIIDGSDKKGGAFISKKILDDIFNRNTAANGIMCYFGSNAAGDDELHLIVTPGVSEKIDFTGPPDHNIYLIESYCPPSCDFVHDPR